ncbi:MAG: hypothetical protein ACI8TX_000309 [Hyphomicrobiaceae bacterium]|jgi:hypothetical protein
MMSTSTNLPTNQSPGISEVLDFDRFDAEIEQLASGYRANRPFPHVCFEGLLRPEAAARLEADFPRQADNNWIRYRHVNENKASIHHWEDFPESVAAAIRELNSPRFVELVSRISGIEGLVADTEIEGGGMHQAWSGGFLNVHKDFTMHRVKPGWRRRCNLILYLNADWDVAWGGSIQLWDSEMATCAGEMSPLLNNALLFNTPGALHGFPDPLTCPTDQTRKSIQLYYYTIDDVVGATPTATTYFARPQDSSAKKLAVKADNMALAVYAWLKRNVGIPDSLISRITGWFTEYRTSRKG